MLAWPATAVINGTRKQTRILLDLRQLRVFTPRGIDFTRLSMKILILVATVILVAAYFKNTRSTRIYLHVQKRNSTYNTTVFCGLGHFGVKL